jgi:hypothetical protein
MLHLGVGTTQISQNNFQVLSTTLLILCDNFEFSLNPHHVKANLINCHINTKVIKANITSFKDVAQFSK